MKLRNKKTGEIGTYLYSNPQHIGLGYYSVQLDKNPMSTIQYGHNFDQLYQDWDFLGEDYEEPKEYYFIRSESLTVGFSPISNTRSGRNRKEIGNYFETKEEAEKAVEKLKAWKRLKDKGFKFDCWYGGSKSILFSIPQEIIDNPTAKDLDLLFGGEE